MILPLLAAAIVQPPAGLSAVRIEHATARVVVISEARGAPAATVRGGGGLPAPTIRRQGTTLVIDGGQPGAGQGGLFDLFDRARCRAKPADLPLITLRLPRNVRISASGAIFGEAGPSDRFDLTAVGCGAWRIAPVRIALTIRTRGRPTVQAQSVDGTLEVDLKGSGDVAVASGHATVATVAINGSGDVIHRGSVGRLLADLRGSGKVRVRLLYGELDASVHGAGDVFYSRDPKHFCGGFQKAC